MSKDMNLQSLLCGILFCISIAALIIACLAFTKKGGGKGEYFKGASGSGNLGSDCGCPHACIGVCEHHRCDGICTEYFKGAPGSGNLGSSCGCPNVCIGQCKHGKCEGLCV